MSSGASTNIRNVGQALVANKPDGRICRQKGSNKGEAGKDDSGGVVPAKNDKRSSAKDGKYDNMRNKCHRCLEPGHRLVDSPAYVIPSPKKSQNGSGEIIGCLSIVMLGKRDGIGKLEQGKDGRDKWIGDSGVTFHITRSADLLRDLHPSKDKVTIGNHTLTSVKAYGSPSVVFANKEGGVAIRLEMIVGVPYLAFKL